MPKRFLLLISIMFCSFNTFALNDPTRTFSSMRVSDPTNEILKLQGVFKRNNGTTAIINGEAFSLGDKVSTYTLNRIHNNSVELIRGDRLLILELRANMRK